MCSRSLIVFVVIFERCANQRNTSKFAYIQTYYISRCHITEHEHYRHKSNIVFVCVWLTAMNMNQVVSNDYRIHIVYSICEIEIDGSVKFTVWILVNTSCSIQKINDSAMKCDASTGSRLQLVKKREINGNRMRLFNVYDDDIYNTYSSCIWTAKRNTKYYCQLIWSS